jgi:hypothetical protein
VGTRTVARAAMTGFVRDVLGLASTDLSGIDADLFELPDGSMFAMCAELRAADVEVDDSIAANDRFRYVHFRAPDGKLYELVEARSD